MKRCAMLLSITVVFYASRAMACRSDAYNPTWDPTTFHQSLNTDVNDYGIFFEEAAPWSPCTQAAADGLYKKIYLTLHDLSWPYNDPAVGSVGPYGRWLSGGDIALIHATALRLANVGKLTKPLDDMIQKLDYKANIDNYCGWNNFWGKDQNSCMDDWAVAAMGYGWVAAYRAKRGLPDAWLAESSALDAMRNALSTSAQSICAWDGRTSVSPAPDSPCTGTLADLTAPNSTFVPISFHTGDSLPYGLGLFTSLASASVAIRLADPSITELGLLDAGEKGAVQKLYYHSLPHTDGTNWYSDCSRFTRTFDQNGNSTMTVTADNPCMANFTSPKMFPIKEWVQRYAPDASSSEPSFDQWDPTLFCDVPTDPDPGRAEYCNFYGPGRRSVYGQMALSWVTSPPIFSSTTLSDYTVTLRTANGYYLSARGGGGADVNAEATAVSPSEQFSVYIRNGHTQLMDGDTVTLQSLTVLLAQWVSAEGGGGDGSTLNANRLVPSTWETFTVHKMNGTGAISNGDPVALSSINGYYVSANNAGGSTVTVDRTSAQWWETFTIGLTHN